jgi:alpha-beta hydrolase superfamily lysophospholipase
VIGIDLSATAKTADDPQALIDDATSTHPDEPVIAIGFSLGAMTLRPGVDHRTGPPPCSASPETSPTAILHPGDRHRPETVAAATRVARQHRGIRSVRQPVNG